MKNFKIKKYIKPLFIALLFNFSFIVKSQYSPEWAKAYGGDGWDVAYSVTEARDGGIILAGYTKRDEKHLWIAKFKSDGERWWGKTYKAKPVSSAKSVISLNDSSLVAVGYSFKEDGLQSDLWVLKLDKNGEKVWDANYGGDGDESGNCIIHTKDNGFAITGYTTTNEDYQQDLWVIKLDSVGNFEWEQSFGGKKVDEGLSIAQNEDEEFVVVGYSMSKGNAHKSFWVLKLDNKGEYLWEKTYNTNKWDVATSVTVTDDKHFAITGYTRTFSVIDYDIVVLKINEDGEVLWKKIINWGRWDEATGIIQTYDRGVSVSGFTKSGRAMGSDFGLVKFDRLGNIVYEKVFNRKSLDHANSLCETKDNGIIIGGSTYSQGRGWDFAMLKFKNDDQATITFSQDSISTSNVQFYTLNVCIITKGILKNVQLYYNDSLVIDNAINGNTPVIDSCNIPLLFEVKLKKGYNKFKVKIMDYKDYETKKKCKIYYMPKPEISW